MKMNRLIVCLLSCISLTTLAKERPNVLFIMSDDHTAQAVGAYATVLKPLNPTPTLDRLAAEGITFDNVTVTGKGTRESATCRECVIDARESAPEPRCSHGESRKAVS